MKLFSIESISGSPQSRRESLEVVLMETTIIEQINKLLFTRTPRSIKFELLPNAKIVAVSLSSSQRIDLGWFWAQIISLYQA